MIDLNALDNDPWSTFPTKKDDLRALVSAVTWQPIETAPYDEPILISWVNRHGNRVVGTAWQNFGEVESYDEMAANFKVTRNVTVWSFDYDGQQVLPYSPTHWMPLPEPPKEGL